MVRAKTKGDNLSTLQRKIILSLATKGPMNINETKKSIKGHYKSVHIAFKSLLKKGLIKRVSVKSYRGQEYPRFWLSEEGVILSLGEGAPNDVLIKKAEMFYPDNRNLHAFLDFASIFNPEVWRIAYYSVKQKGKLEPVDLAMIMITQMDSDANLEKIKQALIRLKKYPEMLESFKTLMEGLERLKELVSEVLGP